MASRILQCSVGKYSLFLPAPLVEGLGWTKGDKLEMTVTGKDRLELRKVEEAKPQN
jgi:bifunctional DNA-binding transcriptional regulator/antitoxin component of YhaV-PrlF toxin-antitoxin module